MVEYEPGGQPRKNFLGYILIVEYQAQSGNWICKFNEYLDFERALH